MQNNLFDTPILFLIFNRPDTTEKVFERICEIEPRHLYISADGPRTNVPTDFDKCEKARSIINKIDWDCNVHTNFSPNNLGCKIGVSSGINWFFDNVEEGIILEDDCLPDLSFFFFCKDLLEYYRNDEIIMHIGGTNFQDGKVWGDGSYYFSKLNHIWGWATWKRAWEKYDVNIKTLPQFVQENKIAESFFARRHQKYLLRQFELVYKNQKDTWDYQWQYTLLQNNGIAIIPNTNLVSNIGFNSDATHTKVLNHYLSCRASNSIDTTIHPSSISFDNKADNYTLNNYINPNKIKKLLSLIKK